MLGCLLRLGMLVDLGTYPRLPADDHQIPWSIISCLGQGGIDEECQPRPNCCAGNAVRGGRV